MQDFERLGAFYLGKRYEPEQGETTDDLILYDSRDLTTHAVCIGMTGSGKTGLAVSLLEEALIDGVPCIIIDPKGDLGNLLLTFPELRAKDFEPWVDPEEARRQAIPPEELAKNQAKLWRDGLKKWGQGGERIRRLRQAADFAIYTPGSTAGRPVAAIRSFAAPGQAVIDDADAFRERLVSTATSLLALLGIDADPLRSREHILLTKILETAWRAGRDLDIAALVREIQEPPLQRVGAFDLETFYPASERFELALQLNNLLAAPGMEAWMEGDPLDVDAFLHSPSGKPRASIFTISHLGDAERMFFVTLLLTEVLAWMRTQPGSSSLRALVYMDEVFGYFPPVANPPSKQPLLTLLKQARAFGLGVTLSTQNPVDLDYKGLSNMGTWFVGRLQTKQDRARVLDGLQSASGEGFEREELERMLADMGKRVFLMNNAHDDGPELLRVRWAMSYLRGPLTRSEIVRLAAGVEEAPPVASTPAPVARLTPTPAEAAGQPEQPMRPVLPPDIREAFLPLQRDGVGDETLVYEPCVVGCASVGFKKATARVDIRRPVEMLAAIEAGARPVRWEQGVELACDADDLDDEPEVPAAFAEVPPGVLKARAFSKWSRDLETWLRDSQRVEVFSYKPAKLVSSVGESERDFRIRLQDVLREARDEQADELRRKYGPKLSALTERLRKAEQKLQAEKDQMRHQGLQAAISVGATVIGALFGRRSSSIGGAATAARRAGQVFKERGDVTRAEETIDALNARLVEMNEELEAELQKVQASPSAVEVELDVATIRPTKASIEVDRIAFVWAPYWTNAAGARRPAWQ